MNKSLILSYKKGLMKKNRVITIPLEFAKSVQEEGALNKYLEIKFEVRMRRRQLRLSPLLGEHRAMESLEYNMAPEK
jgi:hypothetical protein